MHRPFLSWTLGITLLMPCLDWRAQAAGQPQSSVADTIVPGGSRPKPAADAKGTHEPNLHPMPPEPIADAAIAAAIKSGVNFLLKDQNVDGSWGSPERTKELNIIAGIGSHQAFRTAVTSLCISALIESSGRRDNRLNVDPVRTAIERAEEFLFRELPLVRRDQPMLIYNLYGLYLRYHPMLDINRPGGSLGRSQACNVALRLWGDRAVTDTVITTWLDRLITRNGWLDMGRKRPIPHESYFMVAGYFYYYGHYYATLCVDQLPKSQRPFYQDHLARILLSHQERDGSWWDYPLYNYHQQYGTAFAIMSLKRCRKPAFTSRESPQNQD